MINILPPSEKRNILVNEKEKIVLILGILVSIFLLCSALVLFSIMIYIEGEAKAEKIILDQEKREFEGSEARGFSEKIKTANKKFSDLEDFYLNQARAVEIIEKISSTLPEGVYLDSIFYNKNNYRINLSGLAKTQESLYQFRQNLESQEKFDGIYFPPSTWIESENITFNVGFDIKNED